MQPPIRADRRDRGMHAAFSFSRKPRAPVRNSKPRLMAAVLFALVALATSSPPAIASEYGVSTYRPGLSDLFAGYLIAPGGTLTKTMFLFQDARENVTTQDGRFSVSTHTLSYTLALFAVHATRFSLLGTHWAFGTIVQVRLADQRLHAGPRGLPSPQQSSTVAGLGDLIVLPLILNWNFGQFHLVGAFAFYAPTGSYDADRIISIGDNRWAIEPDIGMTWMDEKTGREASLFAGYTVNTENTATHYLSGQEFHADFILAQHLADQRIIGIAGYALQQTTPDSGRGAVLGPFKGRVLGLGPLVAQAFQLDEHSINLSFKYIFEFAAQNRSTGDELWLTAAFRF